MKLQLLGSKTILSRMMRKCYPSILSYAEIYFIYFLHTFLKVCSKAAL